MPLAKNARWRTYTYTYIHARVQIDVADRKIDSSLSQNKLFRSSLSYRRLVVPTRGSSTENGDLFVY